MHFTATEAWAKPLVLNVLGYTSVIEIVPSEKHGLTGTDTNTVIQRVLQSMHCSQNCGGRDGLWRKFEVIIKMTKSAFSLFSNCEKLVESGLVALMKVL